MYLETLLLLICYVLVASKKFACLFNSVFYLELGSWHCIRHFGLNSCVAFPLRDLSSKKLQYIYYPRTLLSVPPLPVLVCGQLL